MLFQSFPRVNLWSGKFAGDIRPRYCRSINRLETWMHSARHDSRHTRLSSRLPSWNYIEGIWRIHNNSAKSRFATPFRQIRLKTDIISEFPFAATLNASRVCVYFSGTGHSYNTFRSRLLCVVLILSFDYRFDIEFSLYCWMDIKAISQLYYLFKLNKLSRQSSITHTILSELITVISRYPLSSSSRRSDPITRINFQAILFGCVL